MRVRPGAKPDRIGVQAYTAEQEAIDVLSPSEVYHENSKLRPHDHGLYTWITFVNGSAELRQIISKPKTNWRGYPTTRLVSPSRSLGSIDALIASRRSVRSFSGEGLDQAALGRLLFVADGVARLEVAEDGTRWPMRTAPSGGGLYPVDLYCLVRNVDGLHPGIYCYDPHAHAVQCIADSDPTPSLHLAIPSLREALERCCFTVVLAAVLPRIKFKYGERGYRFALLEAGHIAQNLLLAAHDAGLGAVPIGGFLDDKLNELLDLDGLEEVSLYAVTVGKVPSSNASHLR